MIQTAWNISAQFPAIFVSFHCLLKMCWIPFLVFHSFLCFVPLSADFECETAFECVNRTWTNITQGSDVKTQSQGYKSMYGRLTSISNTECDAIACQASHSCQQMSLIDVGCYVSGNGVQSLSYIGEVRTSTGSIFCSGVASCIYSTLISGSGIQCLSGQSCSNAIIKSTPSIVSEGGYSMLNAIIYSGGKNISVYLGGYYAGYNLTIICQSGDICDLECKGNACYKTFFKCHSNSVCSVTSCDEDGTGNQISCPI